MNAELALLRESEFTAAASTRLLSLSVRVLRQFFPPPIAEFLAVVVDCARALSVSANGAARAGERGGAGVFIRRASWTPSAFRLRTAAGSLYRSRGYGASGLPALVPPSLGPGRLGRGRRLRWLRLPTPAEGCASAASDGPQVSEGDAIGAPLGEPPKPGAAYRRALPGAPAPSAAASRGGPSRAGLAEDRAPQWPLAALQADEILRAPCIAPPPPPAPGALGESPIALSPPKACFGRWVL